MRDLSRFFRRPLFTGRSPGPASATAIAISTHAAESDGRNQLFSSATSAGAPTAPMLQTRFSHITGRALSPFAADAMPTFDAGVITPIPHPYTPTETSVTVHECPAHPNTPTAATASPIATTRQ